MTTPPTPADERVETDTSLDAERKKADQLLTERAAALEHAAAAVVELAREEADVLVERAREHTNAALDHAHEPSKLLEEVAAARDIEDKLVEARRAAADALLLDNMTPGEVRGCVAVADEHAARTGTRRALLEVSGGITLETVGTYAETGADVVSSGSLTNSSPVLDIGLDIEVHG